MFLRVEPEERGERGDILLYIETQNPNQYLHGNYIIRTHILTTNKVGKGESESPYLGECDFKSNKETYIGHYMYR